MPLRFSASVGVTTDDDWAARLFLNRAGAARPLFCAKGAQAFHICRNRVIGGETSVGTVGAPCA